MEEELEAILARIDKLIAEDAERGRRVAHDLVDRLAAEMEMLASERIELERSLATAPSDPEERTALVEQVAEKLEEAAGRSKFTRELIDSIIERLYGLGPDDKLET